MTHTEGDSEIGSSYSMAANFTFGHFTRGISECERNGGDSTVATTQRQGCMLPQDRSREAAEFVELRSLLTDASDTLIPHRF